MDLLRSAKRRFRAVLSACRLLALSYPKSVRCNACGWSGRRFRSDIWHLHVRCPKCGSQVRHRLFLCALQTIEQLSFARLVDGKSLLHFAPEWIVRSVLQTRAARYLTADYLRADCDLRADMSNMPHVAGASFDTVIAFDVLEHIPDDKKALEEVRRILSPGGYAVFTVPQKENLPVTYENPEAVTPRQRNEHFGQWDHLRIYGDDFQALLESKGFRVTAIDEFSFSETDRKQLVLFPPVLSKHPLATNLRKVYFAQKTE